MDNYIIILFMLILFGIYYNITLEHFDSINDNKECSDKAINTSIYSYVANPINRFVR